MMLFGLTGKRDSELTQKRNFETNEGGKDDEIIVTKELLAWWTTLESVATKKYSSQEVYSCLSMD